MGVDTDSKPFTRSSRCENCQWFDNSITDENGDQSPCRVNPPFAPIGHRDGIWPMVRDSDWCGSWRADPWAVIEEGED